MINISLGVFDVLFGDIFTDNSADSKVIMVPRSEFDVLSLKLTTEPHNHKVDSCSYV